MKVSEKREMGKNVKGEEREKHCRGKEFLKASCWDLGLKMIFKYLRESKYSIAFL